MTIFKVSFIAAALLTTGIITTNAQTVDEIMSKHEKAIGGVDNWNKIKTIKEVGSLTQQGMEINMTQTIAFDKAMRMDISVMGQNGWSIVTKKEGWSYMPFMGGQKIDTMKPEAVAAQQKQMDIKGRQMLDYKANGMKAEYVGRDTINSAPCYKVKFTDKDGGESTSFFDCATYYILRTESKIKQNDEEMEVAIAFNNYKPLDGGIVMPMSITAQGVEITFKSIEVNKPVDESLFVPSMQPVMDKQDVKK